MATKNSDNSSIDLPKSSVTNLLVALEAFEDAQNEIEDYLTFKNKKVAKEIEDAHADKESGRGNDWESLKRRYGV